MCSSDLFPNQKKEQVIITTFNLIGILDYCFENQIQSLLVEGGLHTIQSFIDENLWDEARVFSGLVNFKEGTKAPILEAPLLNEENLMGDSLKTYIND